MAKPMGTNISRMPRPLESRIVAHGRGAVVPSRSHGKDRADDVVCPLEAFGACVKAFVRAMSRPRGRRGVGLLRVGAGRLRRLPRLFVLSARTARLFL
jgi:hypothetical protein